jgi:arylsulfatase
VNGKKVAEGQIPKTQPFFFSGDEGADVGVDGETNVSNDYRQGDNAFTGRVVKVTIELQEMKAADKNEVEKSHKEAALKKGLFD